MPLKKFRLFLLACMICALCAVQASALEYSYDGADDFLFAQPTRRGSSESLWSRAAISCRK